MGSIWHYGVKGMKWGVRRSQAELDKSAGRKTSEVRKRAVNRLQKDAGRSQRVSEGSGSISDLWVEAKNTPELRLRLSKTLEEAASLNLKDITKDLEKLESGSRGFRALSQMAMDLSVDSIARDTGEELAEQWEQNSQARKARKAEKKASKS